MTPKNGPLPRKESLRILIIRLSAMGDVAMTSPVVAELRKSYPNVKIVMLTPAFLQPFFREIPDIEFFAPDFGGRHKGLKGVWQLSRDLGRFDIVADLHDVIRSKMLRRIMRFKGAKVSYIDKGREEKKELISFEQKKLVQLKSTVERYRDVFISLGFDLDPLLAPQRLHYPLGERVQTLYGQHSGICIGIAPFAQHKGKIYPLDKMREVISQLSKIVNVKIFIFGGGQVEKEYAENIELDFDAAVSAIGRMNLTEEIDLISSMDVILSMDSSAMHMASLVGVPVVSVWGATHPYAGFYGHGQNPEDIVQKDMPCRPCSIYGNKPCVYDDYHCMQEVEPQIVVGKICRRLGVEIPS